MIQGEAGETGRNDDLLASEACDDLPVAPLERMQFLRYLGYPAGTVPQPGMLERLEETAAAALSRLHLRGAYSLYRAGTCTAQSLSIGGLTISGKVGEFLGQSGRIAVFVVTAGEEISRSESDPFVAWIHDCVGSWGAERAADVLMERVGRHLGAEEDLTLRYSPGYCGMALGEQRKLFQIVESGRAGVTLFPSLLMHPLKSISGLVGLAPKATLAAHRSPCDFCPRAGCYMRR